MITPWPEKPMFSELPEMHAYERARADAALSRLRVTTEFMQHKPRCNFLNITISGGLMPHLNGPATCSCGLVEALAAIGELPA